MAINVDKADIFLKFRPESAKDVRTGEVKQRFKLEPYAVVRFADGTEVVAPIEITVGDIWPDVTSVVDGAYGFYLEGGSAVSDGTHPYLDASNQGAVRVRG